MRIFEKYILTLVGAILLLGMCANYLKKEPMAPIERLRTRLYASNKLPEPANIVSTGAWYLLHHISSGLVAYDSKIGRYTPFLASSWKISDGGDYTFELSDRARFSDGTKITARDVEASLKRILIKKTSTHFHLWESLNGCEHLAKMSDSCPGIEVVSDKIVRFHLNFKLASFFLQLSTPETGIWAKGDIDPITLEIKPTKFSGPYVIEKMDSASLILRRNDFSPLFDDFPNAPKVIESIEGPNSNFEYKLAHGEADALIHPEKPMGETGWEAKGLKVTRSSPSTILYFHRLDTAGGRPLLGKKFVQAMWGMADQARLVPAKGVLPFRGPYTIDEATVLRCLPDESAPEIRVAIPDTGFFNKEFLTLMTAAAQSAGVKINFKAIPLDDYLKLFFEHPNGEKFDYVFSVYSANERFPAVQLRFITGKRSALPPVDLKTAEVPDMGDQEAGTLRKYQQWLIEKGFVVPMFFSGFVVVHQPNISIGDQRFTAGEVEFWRFFAQPGGAG